MSTVATPGARMVGVDVGGTFTDLVAVDGGRVQVAKVPSTPQDQAEGILAALSEAGITPQAVSRFAHGTTVATNTVLERDGARTVLITTAGFRDLLAIGRQDRPRLYDLRARRPAPVVPSELVVEAVERTGADGGVVTPLTDAEVARVVAAVCALAPEAVAISLLFGFLNPEHECRLADALAADPATRELPVTRASAILPVLREVERTSTVALNAYVAPRMARYLGSLGSRLDAQGLTAGVEVMRSGGGTSLAASAAREPVHTLLSGPAAGAWGAAALGVASGVDDLIACDVGGTSTDVTLVRGGRPATTAQGAIDGLPFAVLTTDIHTIGAGGGSLAWRDDGGALRVGPRSAGAVPGPAAYGRGGTRPTVTDANVVLGRLDAGVRLGGSMRLHPDLARAAVEGLAHELGLGVTATAEGVVRVTDAQMAKALRVVSVERGHDPRRTALVAFGGAGPLHQAALARELGCREVLVPPNPGVLSALGLLTMPITAERARSVVADLVGLTPEQLDAEVARLESEAREDLARQDVEVAQLRRSADLRYRGQAYELEVVAEQDGRLAGPAELAEAFHAAHLTRYGYQQPDEPVELITLRVRAEGPATPLPLPVWRGGGSTQAATLAVRPVRDEGRAHDAAVVDRARLAAGAQLRGPAVVVGVDATCFVAAWQTGEVDDHGTLRLREAP